MIYIAFNPTVCCILPCYTFLHAHTLHVYTQYGHNSDPPTLTLLQAPENALSLPYNQSVDTYAFGLILYEAITGCAPFTGTTIV